MTTSACFTVLMRWAMTNVVRPLHDEPHAFANQVFGFGIDGGGRIIQNQHARIGEDRAGDGQALLLAAGEGRAALAEHRLVAAAAVASMNSCAWASRAAASISPSVMCGRP